MPAPASAKETAIETLSGRMSSTSSEAGQVRLATCELAPSEEDRKSQEALPSHPNVRFWAILEPSVLTPGVSHWFDQ
jgi:hypothetical protein